MAWFPEAGDPGRDDPDLNYEIERQIQIWDGTVHGQSLKNMYENGSSYESICELAGIAYEA